MFVSVPGPSGPYLRMGERIRVPGSVVAEALAGLGPDPSLDDVAEALVGVADREATRHRLEVEQAWTEAVSELGVEVENLVAKSEARERAEVAAEADRILDRVERRQRRHGVSITNRGEG